VLARGRPRGEVTPEAPPDQDEALRVDCGALQGEVDDRTDHVLPVRPDRYAVPDQVPTLPGPVEAEEVVAAPDRGRRVGEVHLLYGRVVAVGLKDRGPRLARVVDLDEVGGEGAALERYLQHLDRRREQPRGLLEAVGFALERLDQAGIHRLAVEREIGRAIVVGSPEVRLARAHACWV
jgi:hypothetical protein